MVANVTERHMVGIHSERERPAAERSFHKHSQTCTTASTRVSLVIKLSGGLLVPEADLV